MPIDASVIRGLRPVEPMKLPDPVEQYGRVMSIKSLMGQQQLQELQTKKATQDLSDEQIYRDAAKESGGDYSKLRDLLLQRGAPHQAFSVDQQRLEALTKNATLQKTQQEVEAKALEQHRNELAGVKTPQDAATWVASAYNSPILGQIVQRAGTLQDALSRIPQDPNSPEWQDYINKNALGMTKYLEQNKPHVQVQKLGGTSQLVSTPGLGGTPTVLSSTPTTLTPAETQNLGIRRQELRLHQLTADPFGMLSGDQGAPGAAPASAPSPAARGAATAAAPSQAPPGGILAGISPDTHGEEFLAKLPPKVSGQVKALAEGRMAFPSGMGLRSPVVQQLLGMVSQYDPDFDAVNYGSRFATRKAFTSGTESKSLNALNTVMGHLDELDKTGKALNNTGIPFVNAAVNTVGSQFSPDLKGRLNQFEITKHAVVDEMERAYRGSGGSQTGIDEWKKSLNAADSYEALRKSIQQGVKLLNSKIESLGDQYSKGMGVTKDGLDLLAPHAKETYNRLLGDGTAKQTTSGTITPSREDIDAELRRRKVIR